MTSIDRSTFGPWTFRPCSPPLRKHVSSLPAVSMRAGSSGPATDRASCSSPTANLEPYYEPARAEVFSVPAAGGEVTKVVSIDGAIGGISLDASGARLAFIASETGKPERSYSQPDLWVASLQDGAKPRNLTAAYDYDIGGGVGGDQHPPRGMGQSRPFWSADGRHIIAVSSEEGRTNLKRIDAETGKVEPLTRGDHDVLGWSATPDGSRVALLISTPTNIGDLYFLGAGGKRAEAADRHQPRSLLAVESHRAGDVLVQELRRQAHPGLGAAPAGFRSFEEVSAHPEYSRRTACRLRLHLRS